MRYLIFIVCMLMFYTTTFAQKAENKFSKISFNAGYGLAGSFFVRSYYENQLAGYKTFYKKKFIGVGQNVAVGLHLGCNYELKFGLHYQHFSRKINSLDTLINVLIVTNQTIHHREYMYFSSIHREFNKKRSLISLGLGLYYQRPKQQEVEIQYPNMFINEERNYQNSRLEDGGVFVDLAYEYKFQPKVNLGVKTQFYYSIGMGEPYSIALLPFIKLKF